MSAYHHDPLSGLPEKTKIRVTKINMALHHIADQEIWHGFFAFTLVFAFASAVIFALVASKTTTENSTMFYVTLGLISAGTVADVVFYFHIYENLPHVRQRKKPFINDLKALLDQYKGDGHLTETLEYFSYVWPSSAYTIKKYLKEINEA